MSGVAVEDPKSLLGSARPASFLNDPGLEDTGVGGAPDGLGEGAWEPRIARLMRRLAERTHAPHRIEGNLSIMDDPGVLAEPPVVRRAMAFALVLRQMPIFIQDDELLVGGRTVYGPKIGPHRTLAADSGERASISYFPTYATAEEEQAAGLRAGAASNHTAVGYGRVLTLGLGGLAAYADRRRGEILAGAGDGATGPGCSRIDAKAPRGAGDAASPRLPVAPSPEPFPLSASDPAQERGPGGEVRPPLADRVAFLRAARITLDAVADLARRYADLAREMARAETRPPRRSELEMIARNCERLATEPPASFWQALQLFLFVRVASMVESYACMPLGRFDQYLAPFLLADLARGVIDRREARELLECLWIKLNEEVDLSSPDDCLRIMLSGQTPDGRDATNELSDLSLEVAIRLRLPSPKVGVRLHRGTPPEFFRRIVETVKLGINGLPEIYNDESIIPALLRFGIPPADARDYCHDGCSEITIGGKSDFYPTWASVRLLRLLSEVLAEIPDTASFDEVYSTYRARLAAEIQRVVADANRRDAALARISPAPFLSTTLEGCLERGLDKTWGGTVYNMTGLLGPELVNTANALAAIRQVVAEDADVTLGEVKAALADNFAGNERLRLRLRNRCPKFGNDDDRVDDIAAELGELFIQEGQRHTNPRGGRFCPGFFDFGNYVLGAKGIGATPDGRRAGESVAGHLSPVGGTDRKGATANIRSMWKVTRHHPPLGTMLDLKLHPSAVRGEEGSEKLAALIQAFLALEGKALQFNVVDATTLRAAQCEPEKYRDLLVRVWGFSAYFVELSRDFQEHIIARTEHGL
ncbi:MAG: hypothetical protein HYY04_13450 [Chloroflexi bacterium]|nr:hypothetical protein [Chloroflexota bacterium]